MNKINIYVLTFFLSLAGVSIYAQNNRSQVVITSGQDNNVFFHTIERGQTVYAIATMYGVTPDDIYRLNPDSKEGIKAGATLKIPQRDIVGGTAKKQDGNYIFHTIQPKETLYSLSIRYTVPATAIVKANPGLSTSTFTIGKTIRIPATQVEDLPTTELKTVTKEIEYTVQKKETMFRICRIFIISSIVLKSVTSLSFLRIGSTSELKPAAAKGTYIKSVYLSSTMSPGIQVDQKTLLD